MDALEMTLLFDYYGDLLTERQRMCFDLRHNQDLSLGEIAEELGVSRQNVHELITRSVQKLRRYEEALGAAKRAEETAKALRQAQSLILKADQASAGAHNELGEAAEMIGHIIRQQEGE